MGLQVNPYLVWQLVPGIVTLAIGLYVLTRYRGRRESGVFFVMMVGGALWAFADAIRLLSPNLEWQRMWINVVYIGVMIVPTSWFMLSTKLAGLKRGLATNLSNWAWLVPAGMYLAVLSNNRHNLFFTSSVMVDTGVFSVVENQYGPLFFAHTAYSYVALVAGVVIIGIEISRNFRRYGVQAYGLIAGVLAPLLGNVYYLFGSVPAGFPDLTPIFFTVTGVAFGWAIFGSRILEVVPHAHGSIVETLTTGVIVLGPDMRILDANQSAREILESARTESGDADPDRIDGGSAVDEAIVSAAGSLQSEGGAVQAVVPATGRTYSITVDPISVDVGKSTGWLVQLTDVSERTRTELDLIETRETLEAVLDTLQDSYFEADVNGVLTYANRALLETLNYSRRDEVIGRHFRKFVDARSARDMYERFSQLFSTGQPVPRFAYFFRRNGGEVREAEASISPIIRNGAVVGSRGTLRDISERVKAERKTAEQTDLLNSVMQQSPIAMAICDLDRKITRVNPAFEGLFGYPKHEALGAELDALLSVPELAREMEELTTRSLEGFVSAASRRRRADGSLVDVEIFAAPLSVAGSRVGFLAFYIDVSERTRAQSELARTQSTVSSILNSLEDPYFEADSAGVITFANRSYWQQLGYDSDRDVLGRSFRHFTDRQTVREVLRRFSVLYRTGEPAEPFDYQCKRKDGSTFVAEIVVSPVLDGEQVVGTRGIIRDASVRIKAEEVLRQAKEAAEFRAGELATVPWAWCCHSVAMSRQRR
jgi:PAS domain S-box-containing protein